MRMDFKMLRRYVSKVLEPKTESSKVLFVNDGTSGYPLYMTILGE
jgi:hypothetical protein